MLDQKVSGNTGDRNKIYFLVIVIVALLGTNAYLYFRDKHENERFVSVTTEKDRLKLEVEKIEVELDKLSTINTSLTEKLQGEQKLAREKISELKTALQKGQFTQGELADAQKEVKELREFIKNYTQEIANLHQENFLLKSERDSLITSFNKVNEKVSRLTQKNSELTAKIKTGASLKAVNMNVEAYKVKNNGKQVKVNNAGAAQKLVIAFDIAPNTLAAKNYHKVYLRVFDPAGNLIADESNMFDAENQQMQYSEMMTIAYNGANENYTMQWVNPKEFIEGTYAVILYADGYNMGKAAVTLK